MNFPPTTNSIGDWWQSLRLGDVARGTVVVMLVLLGFALLLAIRNVLVSVFLGILLATALSPIVTRLRTGYVPRFIAASAAVLLLIALAIGFLILIVPLIVVQVEMLSQEIPNLYGQLRDRLIASPYVVVRQFGYQLQPTVIPESGSLAGSLVENGLVWLPTIGYAAFVVINTLVFTYYWLLYRERSLRGLLLLLPMERREGAESIWLRIEDRIGAFLRGQIMLCLATGGLSLIGYWIVGVPYALLLALIAGLLELVPFVGPFLTMVISVAIGFSVSPQVALSALAVGLIVQQIENVFLAPRIMDKAVGVSPVVTLLAFVGFAALIGPVGALLAIPLAAVLQVLFNYWLTWSAGSSIEEGVQGRTIVDRLRYQLRDLSQDLASHMRRKEQEARDTTDYSEEQLEHVISDLDALLDQAERRSP